MILILYLLARLVSCEKNITLGLSLSLLNQIFMTGVQFKEQLLHLETLEECLLDLISPQTHGNLLGLKFLVFMI